jgi:benzoate-CoA ligase family protein
MRSNTVIFGDQSDPGKVRFAPRFNAALSFIDRHIEEGRGDRIAIRSVFEDVTYARLAERVARCGNALRRMGLFPKARLAMVVKDCPEFFYLFWGAIKSGIVPIPLNTMLRSDDYKFMIEDSRCGAIVYSSEFAGEVEAAVSASRHRPRHVLSVEVGDRPSVMALMGEAPTTLSATVASADDDCFWLYSSGSTANRPKGLIHCHRSMVITSQLYGVNVLGICPSDICFSAAKLFSAYGLGNAMTFPLWVGAATVLLPDRPTPQSTFAIIERFRPTLYFGVPHLYAAQIQALEKSEQDLSSLRLCVSACEALPVTLFQKWRELTRTVILDGIGSTEALHIFISNRIDDIKLGASGRLVPGYDARIVDDRGVLVQQGQRGQLHIRGRSVAKNCFGNPKLARKMLGDWINTGDIFIQDKDGYYLFCGRSDDMLKVSGTWCSPFEIEAVLAAHPGVLDAAVVGRADADGLVRPEAWIVLNEDRADPSQIEAELVQHCMLKLAPYKYPRWFHFVSELPKTANGKVQRFRLRHWAETEASDHSRGRRVSSRR